MRNNRPRYLLDECVQTNDEKIRKKFGFINSMEIIPTGSSDDVVFETAKKKKLTIITKDVRFALRILMEGKAVIFETNERERIHIIPKCKPKIEKECNLRYRNYTTSYLYYYDEIIIP